MSKLKPIGSEKLEGLDKIQRIMEIARYKENIPQPINEVSSREYQVVLADGVKYSINKEKLGYVIKKEVNENFEYIESMKNRNHYRSYSQAFKRLNLIAKEVNVLTGTDENISLFTEDKKYLLKQPNRPAPSEEPASEPAPMGPSSSASPAPSPEPAMDEPMPDEGLSMDEPMPDEDSSMDQGEEMNHEDEISFKDIQKLTGKLSQKIRDIEDEQPLNGKDVKYVINSILSALNLDELSSDDKEEIMSRFEEEDEDQTPSDYEEETDFSSEEEEMPEEEPTPEMEESSPAHQSSIASHNTSDMFGMDELKIEKILKKYFVINENKKKQKKNKYAQIFEMSVTKVQANVAKNLMEVAPNVKFVGRTDRKNLVFENGGQQIKITPSGNIL
jgi:hypothetical protein